MHKKNRERTLADYMDIRNISDKVPRISIFISDGGDPRLPKLVEELKKYEVFEILVERRGSVARSRNLMYERSMGDIIVFIDTDQFPPSREWLKKLTEPIISGKYDYACGPTRPSPNPYYKSKYNDYFTVSERNLYSRAAVDPSIFPMGNSAWNRKVFDYLIEKDGYLFDERFIGGGEDYDINLRAIKYGFRGVCIKDAWVYHDLSSLNTLRKILKKKMRYAKWGTVALLKNNYMKNRLAVRYPIKRHWIDIIFNPLVLGYGFIAGYLEWKKWISMGKDFKNNVD